MRAGSDTGSVTAGSSDGLEVGDGEAAEAVGLAELDELAALRLSDGDDDGAAPGAALQAASAIVTTAAQDAARSPW
jgi:hypothetical protein